jgi:hypothetical protein
LPNRSEFEETPSDNQNIPTALRRRRTKVRAHRRPQDGAWEFEHPRCVRERSEDLEEVQVMLDAGEAEVAIDELRWLLDGCPDFIEVHSRLGVLALEADDLKLARAHFGHAVELGWSALKSDWAGPLPYRLPANQHYHQAAKGLAHSLRELGQPLVAQGVVEHLLTCDPSDPLGVRGWLVVES